MSAPPLRALPPDEVAAVFLAACRAELDALKPGNVHVHAGGHGMGTAHFMAAAEAAAPFVADAGLKPGARILGAVAASMRAAGCNTNLGIVLLSVPLAVAAGLDRPDTSLRDRVGEVLAGLDAADAADVYAAIRIANPGGLGRSEEADVAAPPTVSLLEAMRLAAPRDRIAAAYANGFRDIFEDHLGVLAAARKRVASTPGAVDSDAVTTLHMSLLARFPDSHIRRKLGFEVAAHVQALAKATRHAWTALATSAAHAELLRLDSLLKSEGWNPGTTADFVVATSLAADLEQRMRLNPLSKVLS